MWRTYFETLGIDEANIVFSDATSEEMWAEGSRYGSIDPCYPSKVAQAHLHNLIFKKHMAQEICTIDRNGLEIRRNYDSAAVSVTGTQPEHVR